MASVIDIGLLEGLKPLFIFLIVFAIIYGLLSGTRLLGSSKSIHAIIAFVIAIMSILFAKITQVISIMIPWFIILIIFVILVVVGLKASGVSDDAIVNASKDSSVYWTILIIALIIVVGSLSTVFGQQELNVTAKNTTQLTFGDEAEVTTNTDDFEHNVKATFYHPKVLGFILFILIGLLTVSQLTRS